MGSIINQLVVFVLGFVPKFIVRRFAGRYIAGDSLSEAVALVKDLNQRGIIATLDVLGEGIDDISQGDAALGDYQQALAAIKEHNLDCNVSLKPTQFGLHLDEAKAGERIRSIVAQAAEMNNFVRIDMEDAPVTTATIDLYRQLRADYEGHVGTVVQAYLRRTIDDVQALMADGPTNLRLCKGIYVEPRDIAYKDFDTVRDNFIFVLQTALEGGAYIGIATHDEWLFFHADRLIRQMGLKPDQFEFQMLLGVDEKLQDLIIERGYRLRLYIPYGVEWYAYSMRRLREAPHVAMYIIEGFLRRLFGAKD